MVYRLKRIEIWPAVKIAFVATALIGLGLGFTYSLVMAVIGSLLHLIGGDVIPVNPDLISGTTGMVIAVFFSMAFASTGAFFTALVVWLYNMTAGWIGAIELELELETTPPEEDPESSPEETTFDPLDTSPHN